MCSKVQSDYVTSANPTLRARLRPEGRRSTFEAGNWENSTSAVRPQAHRELRTGVEASSPEAEDAEPNNWKALQHEIEGSLDKAQCLQTAQADLITGIVSCPSAGRIEDMICHRHRELYVHFLEHFQRVSWSHKLVERGYLRQNTFSVKFGPTMISSLLQHFEH